MTEAQEANFLGLSARLLKTCFDIACNESGVTVDIARKMLNFSLQICQVLLSMIHAWLSNVIVNFFDPL